MDEMVEYFYSKRMITSLTRTSLVKDFLLQKTYQQMLIDKEKTKKEDYQKYLAHKKQ